MDYKELNVSPSYLMKMDIMKSSNNEFDFDDETILQIQTVFFSILKLNPLNIDEETKSVFTNIDKILSSKKCCEKLPHIIPFSVYQKIVEFLAMTEDEIAHRIISHVVVVLSNDITTSLKELLKYDILSAIDKVLEFFKFPYSTMYLFQIISNFLYDPNEDVSYATHDRFKILDLFKILQFIKSIFDENEELKKDVQLSHQIINRWTRCIYISLYKYPNDLTEQQATITLIELKKYSNITFEDPLLCKYLCFSINSLAEAKLINYSDFNLYDYPTFIASLACYQKDEEVKTYAYTLIGRLILLKRYSVSHDFNQYFDEILQSNQDSKSKLLESVIFALRCSIESESSQFYFESTTEKINYFFDIYENSIYSVRTELCLLFVTYIKSFSNIKSDVLSQYQSIIMTITDIFFELLQFSDDFDLIFPILESIFTFNNYIINFGYINSPTVSQYISKLMECLEEMQHNEEEKISTISKLMYKAMKEHLSTN